MKPRYEPTIEPLPNGTHQQRFTANQVVVEEGDDAVTLGLAENHSGATIHGLILMYVIGATSSSDLYVEFNGQGNACDGDDIESIALGHSRFDLTFKPRVEINAGRVSYLESADVLDGPTDTDTQISRVSVQLDTITAKAAGLRRVLHHIASLGVPVEFLER